MHLSPGILPSTHCTKGFSLFRSTNIKVRSLLLQCFHYIMWWLQYDYTEHHQFFCHCWCRAMVVGAPFDLNHIYEWRFVCVPHHWSCWKAWITHYSREQANDQILQLNYTGAQIEESCLQHVKRGQLSAAVQMEHLPKAAQELHHHQAVPKTAVW